MWGGLVGVCGGLVGWWLLVFCVVGGFGVWWLLVVLGMGVGWCVGLGCVL
jgi:hypothetical protein